MEDFVVLSSLSMMRMMYTNDIYIAVSPLVSITSTAFQHTACHLAQERRLSAAAWASGLHPRFSAFGRVERALHSRAAMASPSYSPQRTGTGARLEIAAALMACHLSGEYMYM